MTEASQPPIVPESPPRRAAPPTSPGVPLRRPHVWPIPIGIVLIVVGVGGALGGVWTALGAVMMSNFMPAMPEMEGMEEAMQQVSGVQIVTGIVGGVLGALCLAAGIGVLQRKPWGARTARWWAIGKLVFAVASSAFVSVAQIGLMSSATPVGGAPPMPMGKSFYLFFTVVFFLMSAIWLSALPVFLLVWLRRPVIADEIARWSPVPLSEGR